MRVALAQTEIIWEDKEKNEVMGRNYVLQATQEGAQAIFFPEMSLTGFSMNTEKTAEKDEETVRRFARIAKQYHVAVGIGWVKKTGERAENHYTVMNECGDVLSDYVKIHPFSYADEDKYFTSGDKIINFKLGEYKWSTLICYDLRFPELFQIASDAAEVILIPANWPQKREDHWQNLLAARAIENQCYILGVNCVGHINGIDYNGGSCGISPDGKTLGELEGKSGVLMIDIKDNPEKIQEKLPTKRDRKWDFYIAQYERLQKYKSQKY